jgi:hypothetical protein
MSRLHVPSTTAGPSAAEIWFQENLPELQSRVRVFVRRFPLDERPDGSAEILGQVWRYVLSAAHRGKLANLTAFTLVMFFGRSYAAGRRLSGACSTDVYSPTSSLRRDVRIVSLEECRTSRTPEGGARLPLSEVLADRRAPNPLEATRQNLDYPAILRRQRASRKARRVFAWLAQTQGSGRQTELARELRVSEPRVVQLKQELAKHLAAEGYECSGRQRRADRPLQRRARRYAPPLNAGTSPALSDGPSVHGAPPPRRGVLQGDIQ